MYLKCKGIDRPCITSLKDKIITILNDISILKLEQEGPT